MDLISIGPILRVVNRIDESCLSFPFAELRSLRGKDTQLFREWKPKTAEKPWILLVPEAPLGIIRHSEWCRLFRARNNRHGYATHSMENGVNPRAIQRAMGHSSLETTMGYLHAESLSVNSPLETVLGGKLQRPIQNLSTANEK
jgi:integrase